MNIPGCIDYQRLPFDEQVYFKARVIEATERAMHKMLDPAPYWDQVIYNLMLAVEFAKQLDAITKAGKHHSAAQ